MAGSTTLHTHTEQTRRTFGTPFKKEVWWRDHYYDIYNRGYELCPRYHPDWEPSWRGSGKCLFAGDEGQPNIAAARRLDGKHVMLKKVFSQAEPHELRITRLFSSPPFAQDPRNHCVPLLDVIEIPNTGQKLMVMPLLRSLSPRFQTFGEFVAFFAQICEGLQFMHERNVAHRDCIMNNVMFDPSEIYLRGFHHTRMNRRCAFNAKAKRFRRTQRSPRYYLFISGLSRHYTSRDDFDKPLRDGDDTASTRQGETPCNPFRTDIYHLGNLVRHEFMRKYDGFEFMQDLVDEMTHVNPAERPTIEDVVTKFSCIRESQEPFKLCSRIVSKHRLGLFSVFRHVKKAMLTLLHAFSRKAAVPEPDHIRY